MSSASNIVRELTAEEQQEMAALSMDNKDECLEGIPLDYTAPTEQLEQYITTKNKYRAQYFNDTNITGISVGFKIVKDNYQPTLAIIFAVKSKKPESQVDPEKLIPSVIDGAVTDVVQEEMHGFMEQPPGVGQLHTIHHRPPIDSAKYNPLVGGIQIQVQGDEGTGTLGVCFRGTVFFSRGGKPSEEVFLTAFFALFVFLAVINAFNVRTNRYKLVDNLTSNPGFIVVITFIFVVQITFTYVGGKVLRTVGLEPHEWMVVILSSLIILPYGLLTKFLFNRFLNKENTSQKQKQE